MRRRNPRPIPIDKTFVKKVVDVVFDHVMKQIEDLCDSEYKHYRWQELFDMTALDQIDLEIPLLTNVDVIEFDKVNLKLPSGRTRPLQYLNMDYSEIVEDRFQKVSHFDWSFDPPKRTKKTIDYVMESFRLGNWIGNDPIFQESMSDDIEYYTGMLNDLQSEINDFEIARLKKSDLLSRFNISQEYTSLLKSALMLEKRISREKQLSNLIYRIQIKTHLIATPNVTEQLFKSNEKKIKQNLRRLLMHEFTHGYEFEEGVSDESESETVAEIQALVDSLEYKLLDEDPTYWDRVLKNRFATMPFDKAFEEFLSPMVYWHTDLIKHDRLRFAAIQWLQENGFDLPRRRF